MATMNVSVPDLMKDWVQIQINTGKYASSSDYVRDLIRKDQIKTEKIQTLQTAITEGLESGISTKSMADVMKEARTQARKLD